MDFNSIKRYKTYQGACDFIADETTYYCCYQPANWTRDILDIQLLFPYFPNYPQHPKGVAVWACDQHKYEFIQLQENIISQSETPFNESKFDVGMMLTLKASNLAAKITDKCCDGSKYKLCINGSESDWITKEELNSLVKEKINLCH